MLFTYIILYCLKQIKEERTINGVYHLLRGKKSIQVVQDAHLYGLKDYYGIYKTVLKTDFDTHINQLIKDQLIKDKEDAIVTISPLGEDYLKKTEIMMLNYPFSGLRYTQADQQFLKRLFLLVQVLTNRKMNNASFIPVIEEQEVMKWVKNYYAHIRGKESMALTYIYRELSALLQGFSNEDASLFVDRISTYGHYGLSTEQLASKHQLDKHDVKLRLVSIIHQMLKEIDKNTDKYVFLYQIKSDLSTSGFITNSAKETFKLLAQRYTMEEIAHIRHLKMNTIYDHIVEISLYDQTFSIRPYVNETDERAIILAINHTKSAKLKVIKSLVNDEISYFQIRLVLSRLNQMK